MTSTTRHDITGQTASVTSRARYDIAGSVVARLDPLDRKLTISYTDSFNDNTNRNSFAYPTTITDPAGNSSSVKYRFDTGANVRAQSPPPAGNTVGKITERSFDAHGRLEKELIVNTGAYTRYAYEDNGIQSKMFTTIIDANNNGSSDTVDEVLTESWTDGAGRTLRSRTEHPGSIGGWAATITEYDVLGRVKRTSVPTEISVSNPNQPESWQPAGDDNRGVDANGNPLWLWTYQKYDWMNRVVRKIKPDGDPGATENDSDILISYSGCGCTGAVVTTIKGENIIETDWLGNNPVTLGRRTQKVYQDILGRNFKTEVYDWNGQNLYSTTIDTYNGRDQVTNTQQSGGSGIESTTGS